MICHIGIGSNLGNRAANLEMAAIQIRGFARIRRAAPIYQTAALLPDGAPLSWEIPFLNSVLELEVDLSPQDLLHRLKNVEREMGRLSLEHWAPRVIDLDILTWGRETIELPTLQIPHAGLWNRSFVLDPLKDLIPHALLPGRSQPLFRRAREVKGHAPLWMGILNLTPDSFSDGGELLDPLALEKRISEFEENRISIWDLGAESTRPGARELSPEKEWERLREPLEIILDRNKSRVFRPLVSIDTRHPQTALRALEKGIDWINDVSGLAHPELIECLRGTQAELVLMHSLTVPADPKVVLPENVDPITTLKRWCLEKLERLEHKGIDCSRVLFDPGLGFGKTPRQSLEILRRIPELMELPIRILVGHSRKSFLNQWTQASAPDRDGYGIGVSVRLAQAGVDILRVHEPQLHQGAFEAWSFL